MRPSNTPTLTIRMAKGPWRKCVSEGFARSRKGAIV